MDAFALAAKITLDTSEYSDNLGKASKSMSGFGDKLKSAVGGVAKVTAAGVAAAGAAIVGITKQAVSAYADYEQLVGGVETLFGESASTVQEYAANAYKTTGLSANQYMESVTSFSAALLQGLGGDTAKAASVADMAMTDMSDNANKMGTSMESIQNAYQGFAKQNYTMLDNLKLGYGGTKSEMERLLADAEAFSGVKYDISNLSDVYEAIHVVQTEMGITGTTAKEASTTISGSLSAAKAAWQNLLTGLAGDASNLDELTANLMDSIGTVGDNILPVISTVMSNMLTFISSNASEIIPKVIDVLTSNMPQLISAGFQILIQLVVGLLQAIPQLIAAVPEIIRELKDALVESWPDIKEAGAKAVDAIKDGIKGAWDALVSWFKGIWDKLFGNLRVGVEVEGSGGAYPSSTVGGFGAAGGFAGGLDYVPTNDYSARLHRGEMVLTKAEAAAYRQGNVGGGTVINIYPQRLDNATMDYIMTSVNAGLGAYA